MNDTLKPFTEEEKILAEQNHDLIYQFLKVHKYSIEEYYNIVVMGYLKGIQKYYKYNRCGAENFSGICWNCMRSEIGNHFKMENAKKRKPVEMREKESISAEEEVLARETLKDVTENLTIRQQNIIALKMFGYSNAEICLMMEISKSSLYRELDVIRQMVMNGNQ